MRRARGSTGSACTLGIRPESVRLGEAGGSGATPLSGHVFATEPVGSDLFVDVALADTADAPIVKLRTDPDREVRPGERVTIELPHDRLYLFDGTGERLHPEAGT